MSNYVQSLLALPLTILSIIYLKIILSEQVLLDWLLILSIIGLFSIPIWFGIRKVLKKYKIIIQIGKTLTIVRVKKRVQVNFGEFLLKAEHEVYAVGITLESVTGAQRETIKKLLKKHVRVHLLILDPDSPTDLFAKVDFLAPRGGTSETIKGSLASATTVCSELETHEQKNLEIKLYKELPAFAMIAVDPTKPNGLIHYDPYLYGLAQENRNIYKLSKSQNEKIFTTIWDAFLTLWESADDYNYP